MIDQWIEKNDLQVNWEWNDREATQSLRSESSPRSPLWYVHMSFKLILKKMYNFSVKESLKVF